MLSPPCFTQWLVSLGWLEVLTLNEMLHFTWWPNDRRTFDHMFGEFPRCWTLNVLSCSHRSLVATLPWRPCWWTTQLRTLQQTDTPVSVVQLLQDYFWSLCYFSDYYPYCMICEFCWSTLPEQNWCDVIFWNHFVKVDSKIWIWLRIFDCIRVILIAVQNVSWCPTVLVNIFRVKIHLVKSILYIVKCLVSTKENSIRVIITARGRYDPVSMKRKNPALFHLVLDWPVPFSISSPCWRHWQGSTI